MDKRILIGGSVAAVILIIVIIAVLMKKEHFALSGLVASSGSGTPVSPTNYITSEPSGNIGLSNNGAFNNLNVEGMVTLQGYSGNVGDVLVSNGSSASPVWAGIGDVPRLLVANAYSLTSGKVYSNGDILVSVNIPQTLTPNMTIIVEATASIMVPYGYQGLFSYNFIGSIGKSTAMYGGIYGGESTGYTANLRFIFTGLSGSSNTFTLTTNNPANSQFSGLGRYDTVLVYGSNTKLDLS